MTHDAVMAAIYLLASMALLVARDQRGGLDRGDAMTTASLAADAVGGQGADLCVCCEIERAIEYPMRWCRGCSDHHWAEARYPGLVGRQSREIWCPRLAGANQPETQESGSGANPIRS